MLNVDVDFKEFGWLSSQSVIEFALVKFKRKYGGTKSRTRNFCIFSFVFSKSKQISFFFLFFEPECV